NLPLNATYYILFDTPDGITRWVAMETCDVTALPSFGYGTLDETLGFQREGDAEAGEVFADGTICITVDNSLIGGVGQGDVINNIHGDVRVFAGALCSGLVSQVDETASVSDTLRGNQECGPTPVFVSSFDFHETGESVALDWNAVSTDMFTHFNIRRSHDVLSGWETVNSSPIMIDGPGHYTFHDFPEEVRTTYYRLMGVTREGEEILLKDLRADLSGGARGFALAMAGQNPFRGAARISYTVPEDRHVRVEVFSINGQRVKTLVNDMVGAGTHSVTFDMQSDYGRRLPAGVYLVRVQSGNWNQAMQIVAID
ncbi:MAG: T9SS type A sorting domain-containing protein, partial [Candidatus Eisenbacteria bacterium]|nr:T9SS type A sorting domain-containing protein [Candidatus Eisenbacteria bacterium]